jgi:hypothetical protein
MGLLIDTKYAQKFDRIELMIVEINGKKYKYTDIDSWKKRINDLSGTKIDIIAHKDSQNIYFQIFNDGKGYLLQKRADDHTLECKLTELSSSKMIELIEFYFTDDIKFNKSQDWKKQSDGLTEKEKKICQIHLE